MRLGVQNGQYAAVESGLQAGDFVIYHGYETLQDGDPVAPTAWGPEGPISLPPPGGGTKPVVAFPTGDLPGASTR